MISALCLLRMPCLLCTAVSVLGWLTYSPTIAPPNNPEPCIDADISSCSPAMLIPSFLRDFVNGRC